MSNKNKNEQNEQDYSTANNTSQEVPNKNKKKGGVEPMDSSRLINKNADEEPINPTEKQEQ